MPEKLSPYASYGEKLIRLFAKLLFAGHSYSLSELARMLDCSKQTVLRLLDDIRRSYGVEIEETLKGRQKYYRLRTRPSGLPQLELNHEELSVLLMCRAFAEHLLGPQLLDEAGLALEKTRAETRPGENPFTVYRPGSIDYTAHEAKLLNLLKAMELKVEALLSYQPLGAATAKSYRVLPLKVFSHHETIYLSARLATGGDDRLFALHRLKAVELTDKSFAFPADYDFEASYNRNFGIIKGQSFEAEIEFSGFAASYVVERSFSPDQCIERLDPERIRLSLSSSSESELLAWVLSFGREAEIVRPTWLRQRLCEQLLGLQQSYAAELAALAAELKISDDQGG